MDPTRLRACLERFPIRLVHGVPEEGDPRVFAVLHARQWIVTLRKPDRLALTRKGREALERLRRGRPPA